MNVTKLKIKNLFGIKEFDSNGENLELTGKNGTGKTSVIDAIRYNLKNTSERDYIIRNGETEGEILIETNTGLSINRKVRIGKADFKSVKESGKEVQKPEAFLRNIFTELQLNPVEFINMTKQEQNRIVLDLIEFDWDLNWIKKQFGEIPPDVNWEQNILCVLNDIQSEDGYYYKQRHDVNLQARNKKACVEEIAQAIPSNYNVEHWKAFSLSGIYERIEKIRLENERIEKAKQAIANRDNKIRAFQADFEIKKSAIEREADLTRKNNDAEIVELKNRIKELESKNASLTHDKDGKLALAKSEYEKNIAEFKAVVDQYKDLEGKELVDFSELQAEAVNAEKMKGHINQYESMAKYNMEISDLLAESEDYTRKIELARTLPALILEECNIPVDGLTVKDGIPLINGLPISNLSEGEKLDLCINIAIQSENKLNILLIDGVEKLSTDNRNNLYAKLKAKGVSFIATRTDDSNELTVTHI